MQIQSTRWISAVALALVGATVLSGVGLSGAFKSETLAAESAVSTVSVDIAPVCSMIANVTSVHDATLVAGSYSGTYVVNGGTPYANGIGSTTLTAFCNDASGYAIYAVGYTGNTFGDTTMIGNTSGLTIATGTATSGNTSQWAMKLIKVTDNSVSYLPNNLTVVGGFDDYHAVPSAYTKVVSYASKTDGVNGLGSKVQTTYAVYVQPEQISDTYVGQVKYTLVHPNTNDPSSYMVNFYANGGTGTMTSQKIGTGSTVALSANTFTAPAGTLFNGWNTASDGSGTSYANQAQVADLAAGGEATALYAQWLPIMQQVDAWGDQLSVGGEAQAIDIRDNKIYYVARLMDGNIWMTQNLDHDIVATSNFYTYANTDIGHGATPDTSATWTGTATRVANDTTWSGSSSAPESYDPGDLCWGGVIDDRFTLDFDGGTEPCGDDNRHYQIGNYYNWTAAVAMSNSSSYVADGANVDQSICPAGWRLPIGGVSQLGLTTGVDGNIQDPPAYFVYGGEVEAGPEVYDFGFYGVYWSSIVGDAFDSYHILVSANDVLPQFNAYGDRDIGHSVRCVAR